MQRSNSMHLTLEAELLLSSPSAAQAYSGSAPGPRQSVGTVPKNLSMSALDLDLQLSYELDHNDKKKQSRFRPEHAVHLIPVIIFLCGLVLWLSQAEQAVPVLNDGKAVTPGDLHITVPAMEVVTVPLISDNNVIRQKPSSPFTSFTVFQKPRLDVMKADEAR